MRTSFYLSPALKLNGYQVINRVGFLIKGAGKFELLKGKNVIMTLDLTGNGSDGMSDFMFPYEATYTAMSGPNNGVGGCESSRSRRPAEKTKFQRRT